MKVDDMNEDQLQEYYCLQLEGLTADEAASKARYGDALVDDHPHRGPRVGDARTLVLDLATDADVTGHEYWNSIWQQGHDEESVVRSEELAEQTLASMTEACRIAYEYRFGLNGRPMLARKQTAEVLGIKDRAVEERLRYGKKMAVTAVTF